MSSEHDSLCLNWENLPCMKLVPLHLPARKISIKILGRASPGDLEFWCGSLRSPSDTEDSEWSTGSLQKMLTKKSNGVRNAQKMIVCTKSFGYRHSSSQKASRLRILNRQARFSRPPMRINTRSID
jgi:hypothetical protein